MKIAKLVIAFFCLTALSACVDTEEYIVINADNSGTYSMQMDMGKILEMASQMGGEDAGPKKFDNLDSTVVLKEVIDTASNLTAEERKLYRDAVVKIKVNKSNKELKVTVSCPFASINQLPEIRKNLFNVVNKLKALEKIAGKEGEQGIPADDPTSDKSLAPIDSYSTFTAEPGRIETRISNPESIGKLISEDSTIMMMKQMMGMMGGGMTYKTKITTAKEIKTFSGNNALLSADKKTVIFTNSFADMLEDPAKFAFKIEY